MDTDQLLDSFTYRLSAAGVRKPDRVAAELLAHVFGCHYTEVHDRPAPTPPSSGQMMEIIRQLEALAVRIENGESPQDVLGCLDF